MKSMKMTLTWREKYKLALQETLSIKEIMLLRECGQPKAIKLRNDAIDYCINNNIDFDSKRISTEIIFKVTSLNLDYYYNKMIQEKNLLTI